MMADNKPWGHALYPTTPFQFQSWQAWAKSRPYRVLTTEAQRREWIAAATPEQRQWYAAATPTERHEMVHAWLTAGRPEVGTWFGDEATQEAVWGGPPGTEGVEELEPMPPVEELEPAKYGGTLYPDVRTGWEAIWGGAPPAPPGTWGGGTEPETAPPPAPRTSGEGSDLREYLRFLAQREQWLARQQRGREEEGGTPVIKGDWPPGSYRSIPMTPEEEAARNELVRSAWEALARPPELHEIETLTPLQREVAERMSAAAPTGFGALGELTTGEPLWGYEPEAERELWESAVYNPMRERIEETIRDIGERYQAGPGTYWGSARLRAQERALGDWGTQMAANLAQWQAAARQRAQQEQQAARAARLAAAQQLGGYGETLVRTPMYGAWFQQPPMTGEQLGFFYNLGARSPTNPWNIQFMPQRQTIQLV